MRKLSTPFAIFILFCLFVLLCTLLCLSPHIGLISPLLISFQDKVRHYDDKYLINNDHTGETTHLTSSNFVNKTNMKLPHNFDHPATPDNIWVTINNRQLVIRRLAYYDTRDTTNIGIVLISLHDDRKKVKPAVYALLTYSTGNKLCLPLEYWIQSGNVNKATKEDYVNYILRTKGSVKEMPLKVSVTNDTKCQTSLSVDIPVIGEQQDTNVFTYGVCLHKGLFWLDEPQLLVDWVELNKELGAEIITVYFQDVRESMYNILKPYIKSGLVEVLDWSLKKPTIEEYTFCFGQSAVINECIWRNMFRVKYLGLFDIDEYIVPGLNYRRCPEMLQYLEKIKKREPASAYHFRNTYWFEDNVTVPEAKNIKVCSKMRLPRYFKRTQRATHPEKYGSDKLIVKSKAVNSVQVHYVVNRQKGYGPEYIVPNDVGLSHHYRKPYRMPKFTPHEYSGAMGRYVGKVLPRIQEQMCK